MVVIALCRAPSHFVIDKEFPTLVELDVPVVDIEHSLT